MEKKKKPDPTFDGVPAAHAQWAWEHEVAKEFVTEKDAHYRAPAWAEYELARINHEMDPEAGPFSPITVRGAVFGETLPGCEHVKISIAPGASRNAIRRAFDRWLAARPAVAADSAGALEQRDKKDYVAWLRDMAVVRCFRAGMSGEAMEEFVTNALSDMGVGPQRLTALTRGLRKHYQQNGNFAQNHARHLAAERARIRAQLAREKREADEQRQAEEDARWRADLAAAEAAGDKKLAARIRKIAGL